MENLFIFLITFVVVFLVMLALHYKKKKRGELKNSKEILILHHRFKVDKKKINPETVGLLFCLIYSLIIAVVGTIAGTIDFSYAWRLLIAFALMMALMFSAYGLTALYYKRKK